MENYVHQIGEFRPKHFKHKDFEDVRDILKGELDEHTQNLSRLEAERRRKLNEDFDQAGWFSKIRIIFLLILIKEIITGVIYPTVDMAIDITTASTHFAFNDVGWGALTLTFVFIPGFVCAIAIAVRGIKQEYTWKRLINYSIVIVLLPVLYPVIQVMVNTYMVYLMIIRRSREIFKIMGHDVKQFKSLEGFLESGPQFVLQIRILTLTFSIVLSFISLSKTGFNVNVPDEDPKRTSIQYKKNAKFFPLTSIVFHAVCVLFRVTCLSYFFATIRVWTILLIAVTILTNYLLFLKCGGSQTISILLGMVSVFMPNGYLLYNFAATFPVDLPFEGTRNFLLYHMLSTTGYFCACIIGIFLGGATNSSYLNFNIPDDSVLDNFGVQVILNVGLLVLAVLSLVFGYIHWRVSIVPLYQAPRSDSHGVTTIRIP
ncbi:hypothetical protein TCAL_05281 [Tigriopus californicus]|uniref:XK-related protein n=1 Tax=Tigriopus californicus TaxID=6832 RepID=A0A553NZV8_TIGCA|nr:hypothetical protein TCAL_05281 [Tigriopus californicus]